MKKDVFINELPAPLPILKGWELLSGICLIFALILWGVTMLRPQMDERIYARFRNLPKATFLEHKDSSLLFLNEACTAFNNKSYNKALQLFKKDTSTAFLYEKELFSGICLLELNKPEEAIPKLKTLKQNKIAEKYREEATWYLALAYLRAHKRNLCKTTLHEIENSPKKVIVEIILKKID